MSETARKSLLAALAAAAITQSCISPSTAYLGVAGDLAEIADTSAAPQESESGHGSPKSKSEGVDFLCRIECPEPMENSGKNILVIKSDSVYGVSYALEWDCGKKAQRWSAMQMYSGNSARNVRRSGDDAWHEDEDIPPEFRTTYSHHYQNGYDRGHIIASADRLQSRAMNRETFVYSNVHPQASELNSGVWMEMEEKLRSWNEDEFRDTLYVAKGGTIDSDSLVIGFTKEGLLVPRYFFMAVLCLKDGEYKAMAFWIEHKRKYASKDHILRNHAITVRQLEEKTGINFFYNLDPKAQDQAENGLCLECWGL